MRNQDVDGKAEGITQRRDVNDGWKRDEKSSVGLVKGQGGVVVVKSTAASDQTDEEEFRFYRRPSIENRDVYILS